MDIKIKRLIFGQQDFIALEDDGNFPCRAEAMQSMDIDDHAKVLDICGVKPGDVVLDIGGFIGDTALVFARHGCEVHAFEPFWDAFLCMVYNTRGLNVHHWNVAVGNGEPIDLVNEPIGGNFGMRRVRTADASESRTIRIDDLGIRDVRFMKIDCEGREIPAMLGAKKTITRDRPILFVEMYNDGLEASGFTPEQLEQTIKDLGYSLEMYGEAPRWDWICRPL